MRYLISSVLLLSVIGKAFACDICGCASNPVSMGILPQNGYHFVGLRYGLRTFSSEHPPSFGMAVPGSSESFQTAELMFRYQFSKRLRVMAILPYVSNTQQREDSTVHFSGPGDISVLASVLVVDKSDSLGTHGHKWFVNGGVKFATGDYRYREVMDRNLMPGSGSYDFIVGSNYTYSAGKNGFMNESSFSLRTRNSLGFRYGNAFLTNFSYFRKISFSSVTMLIPQAGVSYTAFGADTQNGEVYADSYNNGSALSGLVSLNFYRKNWIVQSTVYLPLIQNLGGGYVDSRFSGSISLVYLIKKRT